MRLKNCGWECGRASVPVQVSEGAAPGSTQTRLGQEKTDATSKEKETETETEIEKGKLTGTVTGVGVVLGLVHVARKKRMTRVVPVLAMHGRKWKRRT